MNDLRVLVVDDSKVGRLTMSKKLEAIGVKVDLVESGQEALDYLEHQRPDMIFMDHMMPDMDGFETTQRIKAAPATRDIPVIIISGNEDEDFVQQARSIGALNAISKPPAPGVLEALLRDLPHLAAAPAPAVPTAKAAPQAVEKPRAPALDEAAVHALVERLLRESMEHLHHELLADLGKQMELAFAKERKAQQDLNEGWRLQLDQAMARMDELRKGAMATEDLGQRLQVLEQRLAPKEAEVGLLSQPDMDALGKTLEQRFAAQLDALSAKVQRLGEFVQSDEAGIEHRLAEAEQRLATLEGVEPSYALDREAILASVDDRMTSRMAEIRNDFLGRMDEQSSRFQEALGNVNSALEQRFADLAHRLEATGSVHTKADQEERYETILATLDERIDTRLDAMLHLLQAKWEEQQPAPLDEAVLRERLSETRLRKLAAETVDSVTAATDPGANQAAALSQESMQAEVDRLKGKVKTLTFLLAMSGAVLLAFVGVMLMGS